MNSIKGKCKHPSQGKKESMVPRKYMQIIMHPTDAKCQESKKKGGIERKQFDHHTLIHQDVVYQDQTTNRKKKQQGIYSPTLIQASDDQE